MGLNGVKWGGIGRNGAEWGINGDLWGLMGIMGINGDGRDRYFIFRGMPETVR